MTFIENAQQTAEFMLPYRDLREALDIVGLAVPPRPALPVLGGVIVESKDSIVQFTAYDYETTISVALPAATRPAKNLWDHSELSKLLSASAQGEKKAVVDQMTVSFGAGTLTTPYISAPVSARPLDEYPEVLSAAPIAATVDGQEFFRQVARVLSAACNDDTLPALNGLQVMLSDDKLMLVGTDRYRLAYAEIKNESTPPFEKMGAMISARVIAGLLKSMKNYEGPIHVGIIPSKEESIGYVTLTMGGVEVTSGYFGGQLVPFTKLIPKKYSEAVSIDRETLARGVKKAVGVIKAKGMKNCPCDLQWSSSGVLTVVPQISMEDQAKVRGMEVPYSIASGSDLCEMGAAFNPSFLLDALSTFTTKYVTLHLSRPDDGSRIVKPSLITETHNLTENDYRHLLMPVRLQN
ncbi:hypothetical protein [Streptomyces sp. NPDC056987]|uniref:DNA polymerase III subunit beta n=1 Tax=Streptomyces sp. NPDC056987 TaxID=3345988 RepID=UPI00362E80ED